MTIKLFSEEEIRSNIIIPLLKDVGYPYGELELETSFSIQLGRGVYNIKNEEKRFIGGRLDILCKNDGKNLFVIELKAEDVTIDREKDRNQGLSYARLLEPMAPYVIVTNGKETYILYSTLTGQEIDKDFIVRNGFKTGIDSEISLRFQALKNFIGYSYDNLKNFCNVFNKDQLENFCAKNSDL